MNFYNPYFNSFPTMGSITHTPLLRRLFGNINLSSILSGTGKVVNFANQAIPLVKQMSPLVRNAKTMFKLMNEFKKVDEPQKNTTEIINTTNTTSNNLTSIEKENHNSTGPTFFI